MKLSVHSKETASICTEWLNEVLSPVRSDIYTESTTNNINNGDKTQAKSPEREGKGKEWREY